MFQCSLNGHVSVLYSSPRVFPLAKKHLGTTGTLFCTIVLLPAVSPYSLSVFILSSVDAMQFCLLTPFKGVNTEAIGLYVIILMAYKEVQYSLLHYLLLLLLSNLPLT